MDSCVSIGYANPTQCWPYRFDSTVRIKKQGVYIDDGEEHKEEVKANFKIYCKTLGKWVSGGADDYKTYVDSIDKATIYESGTTISKLFSTYEYELVEVAIENNYYNNPINLVAATSNLQSKLNVSVKDEYSSVVGIIIYDGKTNTTALYIPQWNDD